MKSKIIKFLKKWLLPPGWFSFLKTLRSILVYRGRESFSFNDVRKRRKNRCFILASGPSILKQDLEKLIGEDVIAVSHVHKHPTIKKIKPLFHVLAPFHEPFVFEDAQRYFEDFNEAYSDNQDVEIFLGDSSYKYSFKNFLKNYPQYNKFKFKYVNYFKTKNLDEANYLNPESWALNKEPFTCRTVVYMGIQLAYSLGYQEIYLLGCDHDYLFVDARSGGNRFYKDSEGGIDDTEHLSAFNREKWFYEYYMRWKHYRLMREFLTLKNTKIYNATEGGELDVFERKKYEELF